MGKVIVVASGKGGTGKTTAVGVLSSCLASKGYKTLCIDCDVGMRNLDMILGLSEQTAADFGDVLWGGRDLAEACCSHPKIPNLYFLSAPPTAAPEDIDPEAFRDMIRQIRDTYDYCLATEDLPSLRDGQRAAQLLREAGLTDLRLIVNRVRLRHLRKLKTTVDDAIDSVCVQLIGVVYEDPAVMLAGNQEIPLLRYEKGRRRALGQFMKIAGRIAGEEIPIAK